ncbi:hypothetical protein, partial [Ralstonia pseudosolanacearum]|uniref:hypothetical protein n=1 Tax=Ralstonia pseudosolanacearum TaxID=1310165 RepID=UPI003CF96139
MMVSGPCVRGAGCLARRHPVSGASAGPARAQAPGLRQGRIGLAGKMARALVARGQLERRELFHQEFALRGFGL